MKKIEAIIRPLRLEAVKAALTEEAGVTGMTITDVRGSGSQASGSFRGQAYVMALPPKIKIELVVPDDEVELVVQTMLTHARTGEEGDGKIFVLPMEEAVRVRTDDRGDAAIQ